MPPERKSSLPPTIPAGPGWISRRRFGILSAAPFARFRPLQPIVTRLARSIVVMRLAIPARAADIGRSVVARWSVGIQTLPAFREHFRRMPWTGRSPTAEREYRVRRRADDQAPPAARGRIGRGIRSLQPEAPTLLSPDEWLTSAPGAIEPQSLPVEWTEGIAPEQAAAPAETGSLPSPEVLFGVEPGPLAPERAEGREPPPESIAPQTFAPATGTPQTADQHREYSMPERRADSTRLHHEAQASEDLGPMPQRQRPAWPFTLIQPARAASRGEAPVPFALPALVLQARGAKPPQRVGPRQPGPPAPRGVEARAIAPATPFESEELAPAATGRSPLFRVADGPPLGWGDTPALTGRVRPPEVMLNLEPVEISGARAVVGERTREAQLSAAAAGAERVVVARQPSQTEHAEPGTSSRRPGETESERGLAHQQPGTPAATPRSVPPLPEERAAGEARENAPPVPAAPTLPALPVFDAAARQTWPVLDLVSRWTAPGSPSGAISRAADAAPVSAQMIHRMLPRPVEAALRAIARLPGLGAGAPLAATVRAPMETLLQRNLEEVRVHESPAAAELGAEAFTTGRQIVFAPGRLDLGTSRGLALLGHELTHVGQPLAFKTVAADTSQLEPEEERKARQQESEIQKVIEEGWPHAPEMQVRRAAQSLATLAGTAPGGAGGPSEGAGAAMELRRAGAAQAAGDGEGPNLPAARLTEVTAPSGPAVAGAAGAEAGGPAGTGAEAGGGPPDVNAMAQQVYAILKSRLRAERDRHELYR